MEGLVEGRVVHFVMQSATEESAALSKELLVCRPALIVNALGGKQPDGKVNLLIFLDGDNDKRFCKGFAPCEQPLWETSVKYSETSEVGTWHWPERN